MSESLEPGSQATFTHSPWRGLAASRALAAVLLGGRAMLLWPTANVPAGAVMYTPLMCTMCSSVEAWR